MQPFFEQDNLSLYCGDLREVLPALPEASVDFVVTDPPYGLSFMERDWDHEVPGPEYWRAVARVCKPGALMLAFGGTRTYHHLTYAIEQAGWEIRDCLMWLYGQGMPKCGDIGKLIDKSKGAERQVVGDKLDRPGYHLHEGKGNGCYGGGNGLHAPGTDARLRAAQITAPATPEAVRWTGWAMALKPAWEPIVLAMKPMDGTIAHNALTWGVAGMNVEASRIGTESTIRARSDSLTDVGWASTKRSPVGDSERGRWPANLLLDAEAATQLDAQTGTLASGTNCIRTKPGDGYHGDIGKAGDVQVTYGDSGGASRFFYCGKATRRERGPGNDHPTVKPLALMEYLLTLLSTPDGGVILDPFAGSGTTLLAAKRLGRRSIGIELTEHNCEIARGRLHVA
jgi:site-specific DNA-methyltransferase (adenine-specific)